MKLNPNAKQYFSTLYSIPHSFLEKYKVEINELVLIGVFLENVGTAWQSSSFFRCKKDRGIRFVSDLRKLSENIKRDPFPFLKTYDIIFKIKRFTFAKYLDLNLGYCHFEFILKVVYFLD